MHFAAGEEEKIVRAVAVDVSAERKEIDAAVFDALGGGVGGGRGGGVRGVLPEEVAVAHGPPADVLAAAGEGEEDAAGDDETVDGVASLEHLAPHWWRWAGGGGGTGGWSARRSRDGR